MAVDTVTITGPIYFDSGRSTIRPDAAATLDSKISWLQANPGMRIRIEGNAEERGTDEYNLAIGQRRAQAAKHYLLRREISRDRIDVVSYGRERPICTEHTEACRVQNRRDDFRIVTIGSDKIVLPGTVTAELDTFPWPPPNPSKWAMLPSRLCNDPTQPTIGRSWEMIRDAFRRGGFPENERTYLIPPDGFAMVGQMEAIHPDATFLPPPDRWAAPGTPRISPSSFGGWLGGLAKDLFQKGRYRLIVIAVTNRPSRGPGPPATTATIRRLSENGLPGPLPPPIKELALPPATGCFALVYEFERPADPLRTKIKDVTRAEAVRHLVRAALWTQEQLRFP